MDRGRVYLWAWLLLTAYCYQWVRIRTASRHPKRDPLSRLTRDRGHDCSHVPFLLFGDVFLKR